MIRDLLKGDLNMKPKIIIFSIISIVVIIALAFVFQMRLRGFKKVGTYENWIIYENLNAECEISERKMEGDNKIITVYSYCNDYMLKDGKTEVFLFDLIINGEITEEKANEILDVINDVKYNN
jgi:hypothetical protein